MSNKEVAVIEGLKGDLGQVTKGDLVALRIGMEEDRIDTELQEAKKQRTIVYDAARKKRRAVGNKWEQMTKQAMDKLRGSARFKALEKALKAFRWTVEVTDNSCQTSRSGSSIGIKVRNKKDDGYHHSRLSGEVLSTKMPPEIYNVLADNAENCKEAEALTGKIQQLQWEKQSIPIAERRIKHALIVRNLKSTERGKKLLEHIRKVNVNMAVTNE